MQACQEHAWSPRLRCNWLVEEAKAKGLPVAGLSTSTAYSANGLTQEPASFTRSRKKSKQRRAGSKHTAAHV